MKIKLFLIIAAVAGLCCGAKAQDVPNYYVAGQLSVIIQKIGLPVDSAAIYLKSDYTKVENTPENQVVYKSNLYDVYISFEKNEGGQIALIKCFMASSMLSTAQKAITLMGMIASGTQAPPGFTAYATPKYAAFLNPQMPEGHLTMVMVQGGK
jgi:hypothetical protein